MHLKNKRKVSIKKKFPEFLPKKELKSVNSIFYKNVSTNLHNAMMNTFFYIFIFTSMQRFETNINIELFLIA